MRRGTRLVSRSRGRRSGLIDGLRVATQDPDEGRASLLTHVDDRPATKNRLGRAVLPDGSRRINGNEIPHHASAVVLTQQARNQPILVPELCGPDIGNPLQGGRRWRRPIRPEDRLPNDESPHRLSRKLLQDAFGSRGPLEADGSGGRQEQQHPNIFLGGIKIVFESRDILGGNVLERRLPRWHPAPSVKIKSGREEYGTQRADNDSPFQSFTSPANLLRRLPSLVGKRARRT